MKRKTLPTPEEIKALARGKALNAPEKRDIVDTIIGDFTQKQKKYAVLCVTHPNLTDVERQELAGYVPNSGMPACLKQIDGKIGELLLAVGITGRDFAEGVRDQLRATKVIFRKSPKYNKQGRVASYEDQKIEVPDNTARGKTLELLAKTGNYYPVKVVKGEHTHKHSIEAKQLQAIRDREQFLSKEVEGSAEVINGQSAPN